MTKIFGMLGTDNLPDATAPKQILARLTDSERKRLDYVSGSNWFLGALKSIRGCLYSKNSKSISIIGQPYWKNPGLTSIATKSGIAESILFAHEERPLSFLTDLYGDFALAIVDSKKNEAFIAIDRFGIGNLAYTQNSSQFIFADNANLIKSVSLFDLEIDAQSIFDYVYFHAIPGPNTIYKNTHRLTPGSFVQFKNNRVETGNYWTPDYCNPHKNSFSSKQEEFFSLLESSIQKYSTTTGTGAFLSGGTDSSTVTGILSKVSNKPVDTFSIGFKAEGYDETEYARITSKHYQTHHHEYYVTPSDVVDAIPKIAAFYDQPFGNASAVPTYYCAKLAKKNGISLLLGGDGGDELFGGNTRYAKQKIFGVFDILPKTLQHNLNKTSSHFPFTKKIVFLRKIQNYIKQASIPMPERLETYNLVNRIGVDNIFEPSFLEQIDRRLPVKLQKHIYNEAKADTTLNRMLAVDLRLTLADNDLRKVTSMCDMAQMNVAFPLLSDELFDFSVHLPDNFKLKGTQLRWFFKEALKEFLPPKVITKSKHGFGLPFGLWMQTDPGLHAIAVESLNSLKNRGIIKKSFIDDLINIHLEDHASYYGTMIWILLMLEQWFQSHIDN